jgi:murein DD-endopeptidase MepM/ murein hydrolase activator NlpD
MKRLVILLPALLAFQVGVQPALAWTWPVDGPVLRPFNLGSDPYAAGQHRGIDIGAPTGTAVRAPASGAVSFAGTVPGGGRTIAIRTSDGYSVTLVHLGTIGVSRGAQVEEGATVGTIGPSGDPAGPEPYVYLGIRVASDPNGYLDPLSFLPARSAPAPNPAPSPEPEPSPVVAAEQPVDPSPPEPASPVAQPGPGTAASRAEGGRARTRAARVAGRAPARFHAPAERSTAAYEPTAMPSEKPALALATHIARVQPARQRLRSFEQGPIAFGAIPRSRTHDDDALLRIALLLTFALGAAVGGLTLLRQLGDARAADVPAAVLFERGGASTEDAGALRLGEEDGLVLDGDLERILLAQAEALPNLDRDDDPAKLIDVSDDPRPRHALPGAGGRPHRLPRTVDLRPVSVRQGPRLSVPLRCPF